MLASFLAQAIIALSVVAMLPLCWPLWVAVSEPHLADALKVARN